ncbi:P-loop containing nucleoside triphosphate hydrolase protein [Xylaria telfairii]|nr:P-loop containing nucleoside triphosphate hydrolase protein [Xylaria telfairii]
MMTPDEKWVQEKGRTGYQNAALDELMILTGLQNVKTQFLQIWYESNSDRALFNISNELLNAVFLGDTGTGKTTIAGIYSRFLASLEVFGPLQKWTCEEIGGLSLASNGVLGVEALIDQITKAGGGTLFIDDAHQLLNAQTGRGADVLDRIVTSMKNPKEKVVFIFAGRPSDMEKYYEHNKSLREQIRYTFELQGYDEDEVWQMLHLRMGRVLPNVPISICNQQPQLCLLRVIARRIILASDVAGYGNVWAVRNMAAKIKSRFLCRLGENVDIDYNSNSFNSYILTQHDVLGPGYADNFKSKALDVLDGMIGLEEVKKSVRSMVKQVHVNRTYELNNIPLLQTSLNKVFLGNPGTGKTTVAKLYGQILVELGMLSNGEVVTKTPADFISEHMGGSESNTKAILESTKGKVLIIDEAYGLGNKTGGKGASGHTDAYRSGIIDTLVANINSQPGEDRCVLLLGYKDKMEEMYQDVNPGFKRRFPLESAFVFEDYDDGELREIWEKKLQSRGLKATGDAKRMAMWILKRQKHKLNFGNAGEVDIILDAAQRRCLERTPNDDSSQFVQPMCLEIADIDPDYRRLTNASAIVDELFEGVVGCDEVQKEVRTWPTLILNTIKGGIDIDKIFPMSFAFTGPPGTGKTTTAKNMGTILYSLGLLASNEVDVVSATELVGEYIGQTGPKVRRQFEASLGKVLFIDEAYRLDNGTAFGKDAINEIVTLLTEDKFKNHLFVIFAGYEKHIKRLLNQNPGLASRVPKQLHFPSFTAEAAIELLCLQLNEDGFNTMSLDDGGSVEVVKAMGSLVALDNWANGRSIENLSREIRQKALTEDPDGPVLDISEATILDKMEAMRQMLIQQLPEPGDYDLYVPGSNPPQAASDMMTDSEPKLQMISVTKAPTPKHGLKRMLSDTSVSQSSAKTNKRQRNDASGVSFGIIQLAQEPLEVKSEAEKIANTNRRRELQEERLEKERKQEELQEREKQEEEKRQKREMNRRAKEDDRRKKAQEKEKEKAKARAKQRMATLCPAGYAWHHTGGGWYKCGGGSHEIHIPDL